jgi:hypothetical protein|tara:strand:- start:7092 stop:7493 length:402 start_codon:yes stop_codon:yes gene_type:complete
MKSTGEFIMRLRTALFAIATSFLLAGAAFAETALIMVEEQGCVWCARWNKQIAPIYPKTPEGKAAPLRRIDINAERPDDLTFARSLRFTPTFVLMIDGNEVSRIEGYPGEDFFWGLLGRMLSEAEVPIAQGGS